MARSLLDEQGNCFRKVPSGKRIKHGESLEKELPYQWRSGLKSQVCVYTVFSACRVNLLGSESAMDLAFTNSVP